MHNTWLYNKQYKQTYLYCLLTKITGGLGDCYFFKHSSLVNHTTSSKAHVKTWKFRCQKNIPLLNCKITELYNLITHGNRQHLLPFLMDCHIPYGPSVPGVIGKHVCTHMSSYTVASQPNLCCLELAISATVNHDHI